MPIINAMECILNSRTISFEITSLIVGKPYLNATIQSVGVNNSAPDIVPERSAMTLLMNYSISMIRVSGRLYLQRTLHYEMSRTAMEPAIRISSIVQPYENAKMILESIKTFFPDCEIDNLPVNEDFPAKNHQQEISGLSSTLEHLLIQIRNQRILDTALDVMTVDLESDKTYFFISRQAAIAGKVSFIVDGKNLGGVIRIDLSGEDLDIWLEQQTWHEGRNQIPRYTGDELAMRNDGEPSEWFDKRGRPTINLDED